MAKVPRQESFEFIPDKPIESFNADELERGAFARSLAFKLKEWSRRDSLVVGVFGEWGSGKSSIIRLALRTLAQDSSAPITVIELNPWAVSGNADVVEFFYNEISKVLGSRKSSKNDKRIAAQLRYYSTILRLAPDKSFVKRLAQAIIVLISWASITSWWTISISVFGKVILSLAGIVLLLISVSADILERLARMFDAKSLASEKPLQDVKRELSDLLRERKNRILIVIDDIDRLTRDEIRKTIAVVKANADLPNTIYLLPFDQDVVEACFDKEVNRGQGKKYIEKVVEVSFDVPHALPTKVIGFLTRHLDLILAQLPPIDEQHFKVHWQNVFFSGYRNMFRTIRDVKRYLNSLSFNLSLLSQNNTLEVNPIDFFAIEAIRVFHPKYYGSLKNKKELYTRPVQMHENAQERLDEVKETLKLVEEVDRPSITELIERLFPVIGGLSSNTHYGDGHKKEWNKHLLVCAPDYFDRYFTLVPGGSENEVSEFELTTFFASLGDLQKVEEILREKLSSGKIRQFLERIQDYTDDQEKVPLDKAGNLVLGLFNISDDLPRDRVSITDVGPDMNSMRIIFQSLNRDKDQAKNFEILRTAITKSKSLFGPVQKLSLEPSSNEARAQYDSLVEPDKLPALISACLDKIYSFAEEGKLLDNKDLVYILFRWREWDETGELQKYIDHIKKNDEQLLRFVSRFEAESISQGLSEYALHREHSIRFNYLARFLDLYELRELISNIRNTKLKLYGEYKQVIDETLDRLSDDTIKQINEHNLSEDDSHNNGSESS